MDSIMFRWIAGLLALCVLTAVIGFWSDSHSAGLARILCGVYAGLLGITLVIGLLRRA